MSDIDQLKKVYKAKGPDFGNRLTAVFRMDPHASIGIIYQGLYYDGSGYDGFDARHIVISSADFVKNWVEVEEPDEIPEGRL